MLEAAAHAEPGDLRDRVGLFINTVLDFVIVAFAIFLLIRQVNRFKKAEAPAPPATKECPFCLSSVPLKASKCGFCTSTLEA